MQMVYWGLFFILTIAVVIGFSLHWRMLEAMKARHTKLWESLGKPTFFRNNSISNSISVQGFLWKKKYLDLNDPVFIKQCDRFRYFQIIYLFLFLVFFISILSLIINE